MLMKAVRLRLGKRRKTFLLSGGGGSQSLGLSVFLFFYD